MEKIGRIKYTSNGEYSPDATYTPMNTVLFEGSRWECIKESTGNDPPDHVKNEDGSIAENEFWRLFLPGALGDDYIKKTDLSKPPTETGPGKAGVNFPDGKTIQIDENGMLTGTPLDFMGTWKELQDGIASGEITEGMIGYINGTPDNPEDPDHPNSMLIHIDDYLSLVSSNAVQNRIITAAINQIRTLAEQNAQIIEQMQALRSTLETFGLSKICPVETTDVTENNGIVLGAVEKNASVSGTIANGLQNLKNKLEAFSFSDIRHEAFHGVGNHSFKIKPSELCMIHATVSPNTIYTAFFGFAVIRDAVPNVTLIPVFPATTDGGFGITTNGDTITFTCGWGYDVNYWILSKI